MAYRRRTRSRVRRRSSIRRGGRGTRRIRIGYRL